MEDTEETERCAANVCGMLTSCVLSARRSDKSWLRFIWQAFQPLEGVNETICACGQNKCIHQRACKPEDYMCCV